MCANNFLLLFFTVGFFFILFWGKVSQQQAQRCRLFTGSRNKNTALWNSFQSFNLNRKFAFLMYPSSLSLVYFLEWLNLEDSYFWAELCFVVIQPSLMSSIIFNDRNLLKGLASLFLSGWSVMGSHLYCKFLEVLISKTNGGKGNICFMRHYTQVSCIGK